MGYGPLAHFKGPSSFWARINPAIIPLFPHYIAGSKVQEQDFGGNRFIQGGSFKEATDRNR